MDPNLPHVLVDLWKCKQASCTFWDVTPRSPDYTELFMLWEPSDPTSSNLCHRQWTLVTTALPPPRMTEQVTSGCDGRCPVRISSGTTTVLIEAPQSPQAIEIDRDHFLSFTFHHSLILIRRYLFWTTGNVVKLITNRPVGLFLCCSYLNWSLHLSGGFPRCLLPWGL
jgi:hypothetical protein